MLRDSIFLQIRQPYSGEMRPSVWRRRRGIWPLNPFLWRRGRKEYSSTNSGSHGTLQKSCSDVECATIRNEGLSEISSLAVNLNPADKWFSDTLVMLAATHPSGANIFTGMWNLELRNTLRTLIDHSGYIGAAAQITQWKVVLDDVSHSLVLITRALVANRLAGPDAPPQDTGIGEKISLNRHSRIARRKKLKVKGKAVKIRRNETKVDCVGIGPPILLSPSNVSIEVLGGSQPPEAMFLNTDINTLNLN